MADDVTRSQQVLGRLRELLLSGAFRAHSRLREAEIAERLQVSRTPVRDALAALANEGLLLYEPNCGYSVRAFGLDDLLAAFDVRSTLEGMACRVVAERRISPEGAERLATCMAEGKAILTVPELTIADEERWNDMNRAFHRVLAEESGNQYLVRSVRDTMRVPMIYDSSGKPHTLDEVRLLYGRDVMERSLDDHARIVDAVLKRQASRAEYLMREHIYLNREALRENFTIAFASEGAAPSERHAKRRGARRGRTAADATSGARGH